jgi:glucose/arabinose dehydrogenase
MITLLPLLLGCESIRAAIVSVYPTDYEAESVGTASAGTGPVAVFDGADADRDRLNIRLHPVADGFTQPVDIQFPPGESERMVVVERGGTAWLLSGEGLSQRQKFLTLEVLTASEQGLLGLAFHPEFADNGRLFTNATVDHPVGDVTQVTEWRVEPGAARWEAVAVGEVLKLRQPYGNHNAGQLAFGPDGYLYIGFGDGGWRDDPAGNGQNGKTWLGSMLRIDINGEKPYAIPADNPFRGSSQATDETYAIGLRNPWRYSFAPDGRLIVADVGQDTTEEVHIVAAGDNLGWALREGRHCFPPTTADCPTAGLVEPIYTYPRTEGVSITGGYVVTDGSAGALSGRYVFGDFASGRLWALDLPATVAPGDGEAAVHALGRWGLLISTFGRDGQGRVYLADYGKGAIYRIEG